MRCLFGWLCFPEVNIYCFAQGNYLSCLCEVQGYVQRASDIVSCTQREYTQGEATFRDMVDDTTDQTVTACCYSNVYAAVSPVGSLRRKFIQVGDRSDVDIIHLNLLEVC